MPEIASWTRESCQCTHVEHYLGEGPAGTPVHPLHEISAVCEVDTEAGKLRICSFCARFHVTHTLPSRGV